MKLTSKIAQNIQDEIFINMSAEEKIKMVSDFFRLGKKLSNLNDRKIDGSDSTSFENSDNIR